MTKLLTNDPASTGDSEHASSDDFTVCVWPDGTWCWLEEVAGFSHMSDDYQRIFFYEHPEALEEMTECPLAMQTLL